VSGPLHVYVDWDRNGNFTGPSDDVTDDVRGTVSVSFGRESVTALAPLIAGRGSFDLDNTSRRYSPRNASSPLFGKVKPARPVLITRDVKVGTTTTTYTIFRGHIDDTPISPDVDGRLVTVNLVDSLQDFQQNTISTELWQGLRSGDAIGKILDAAGWTGGRDLDPGCSIFTWWWAEGSTAASALQDVLDSEGPPVDPVGVDDVAADTPRHRRRTRAGHRPRIHLLRQLAEHHQRLHPADRRASGVPPRRGVVQQRNSDDPRVIIGQRPRSDVRPFSERRHPGLRY
jgi:hypothetical protein